MYKKHYKRLQFSLEQERKLRDFIKQHPCLFNRDLKEYKNTVEKDRLWQIIANQIGKTTSDVKMRWKNIRDYHRKVLRKSQKPTEPSLASDVTCEEEDPLWFIKDSVFENAEEYYKTMGSETADDDNTVKWKEERDLHQDESLDILDVELNVNNNINHTDDTQTDDDDDSDSHSAVLSSTPSTSNNATSIRRSKETKKNFDDHHRNELYIKQYLDRSSSTTKGRENDNDIDKFFQNKADIVKTLPPNLVAKAKFYVTDIISKLELEHLKAKIND